MPGGVLDDVGELDSMSGSPSATVVSRGSWLCTRIAVGSKSVASELGSGGGSSEIDWSSIPFSLVKPGGAGGESSSVSLLTVASCGLVGVVGDGAGSSGVDAAVVAHCGASRDEVPGVAVRESDGIAPASDATMLDIAVDAWRKAASAAASTTELRSFQLV